MNANELLLIDAGAEYDYYAADVTRTFPVGGTFTKRATGHLRARARRAGSRHRQDAQRLEPRAVIHMACVEVITRKASSTSGLLQGEVGAAHQGRSLQAVLHAQDESLARHGRARCRQLLRRRQGARARARHGAHGRTGHLHRQGLQRGSAGVARHRRSHRGRHPRDGRRSRQPHAGDSEDGGGASVRR